MIGLTTEDLNQIRGEAANMLTQTGRVRRREDGVWTTVTDCLPCLLALRQGREDMRVSDAAMELDADVVLSTLVDADIRVMDRVTVDNRIVEVRYRSPRSVAHARWLGKLDTEVNA